jgi:hypothetical protein
MSTSTQNPAAIQPMSFRFSNSPTRAELLQVQDKYNELLAALKRP